MGRNRMGYEGQLFYGTPGATGATQILNATDISYGLDAEMGETTVRGTGLTMPLKTSDPTALGVDIQFTMVDNDSDTVLLALRTAAYAGAALAIRTKDYSTGKGFDGDCTFKVAHGQPLKGEQTLQFTCTPTGSYGRQPVLFT